MTIRIIQQLMQTSTLFGVVFVLLFNSCSFEQDDFIDPTKGITTITFSVNMPNKARSTYALTEVTENNISSIYVLAFSKDGDNYKLADWSTTTNISDNDNGSKRFSTSLTRLVQGDSYKFVLLANAKEELTKMALELGTEQEALLKLIQVSANRWIVAGDGIRDIPMWGETANDVEIKDNISVNGISMVRMLAKINVNISAQAPIGDGEKAATDYFELKSVHLYNAYNTGHLVPASGNMSTDNPLSVVVEPTLVNGSNVNEKAIEYEVAETDKHSFTNTIYTFESEVPKDKDGKVDTSKLTSLVIGGIYDGDGNKETYYRLDIKGNTSDYLDLLRNHNYTIKIVKIIGSGYDKPDDAFNSKPINMEAEIVNWNETQVGDIHESDGYNLSIYPESEFQFYKGGGTDNVTLTTNHPDGWKVTKIEGDSWITVKNGQGAADTKATMEITTTNTTTDRTGYIYVKFARTEVRLTVMQSANDIPVLEITSNGEAVTELLFTTGGNDAEPQTLDVKWLSDIGEMNIINNSESAASPFVGKGVPATSSLYGAIGSSSFVISPTTTNKPIERETKLEFKVSNGGNEESKNVLIKHINYGLMTDAKNAYYMNGEGHKFTVKSNASWKIASVTELKNNLPATGQILTNASGDNLEEGTGSDANMNTGTTIQFTTTATYIDGASLKVAFMSTDPTKKFADQEITINFLTPGTVSPHQGWAGSNIYWDDMKQILTFEDVKIPGEAIKESERWQGVFFKWGSLWGISPIGGFNASSVLFSPDLENPSGRADSYTYKDRDMSLYASITRLKREDDYIPPPGIGKGKERDYAFLTEFEFEDGGYGFPEHGDICKYLTKLAYDGLIHGKKWRMPTSMELDGTYKYEEFTNSTPIEPGGKSTRIGGLIRTELGNKIFFPSSGFLNDKGRLVDSGRMWTSSPANEINAYNIMFDNSSITFNRSSSRDQALTVRCVVDAD